MAGCYSTLPVSGQTDMATQDAYTQDGIDTATDLCVVHDKLTSVDTQSLSPEQEAKLQEAASHIDSVAIDLFSG